MPSPTRPLTHQGRGLSHSLHLRRRSRAKSQQALRPLELRRPHREADEDDHPAGAGQRHERQAAHDDQQADDAHHDAVDAVRGGLGADPAPPGPVVVLGVAGGACRRARRWCRSWPESPTGPQGHGSMPLPGHAGEDLGRARAVTGPGAGSGRSSTAEIGSTSLVELVRNTSSAVSSTDSGSVCSRTGSPSARHHSMRQLAGDAGQAAGVQRRREQHAVHDDEDVGAGALAQLAAGVGEDRLDGRRGPWRGRGPPRSRRTTSSSARRSRCARCGSTGPRRPSRAPAAAAGAGGHDVGEGRVAAVGAQRPGAAGDAVAQPAERDRRARTRTAAIPSAMTAWSAAGRPSPASERSSRRAWRVRAKPRPSTTLQVSNTPSPTVTPWSSAAMAGWSRLDHGAVDPDPYVVVHTLTLPDASPTSRAAFSSVSAHSCPGSEPHVMPAPVPKRSQRPPSGHGRPRTCGCPRRGWPRPRRRRPSRPRRSTARGAPSRGRRWRRRARGLRAPRTPSRAATWRPRLRPAHARPQPPRHRRHQVDEPGVLLGGAQGVDADGARAGTRGRGRCAPGRRS